MFKLYDYSIRMKKNIIIICYGFGGASGLVFKRLVCGLSSYYNIKLIVSDIREEPEMPSNVFIQVVPYFNLPKLAHNLLKKKKILVDNGFIHVNEIIPKKIIKTFGSNLLDKIWGKRIIKHLNKYREDYSFVLGLMGYNSFQPLIATSMVAERLSLKSALYTTDANPVTHAWDPDDIYREKAKKLLNNYYSKLNLLYFSNDVMAEYERNLFNFRDEPRMGVVLTNTTERGIELPAPKNKIFLYIGSIWGPRTTKYLFEAFKLLLKDYPDAKLCFVGTRDAGFSEGELSVFSPEEKKAVLSYPRTSNLIPYYENSISLIDLNADAEGDPFMSSKITNYIIYDRPIICETGINSAAGKIFKNFDSIYVCNHNSQELYKAMVSVIEHQAYDYSERKPLIEMFSLSVVSSKFHEELKRIEKN